MVAETWPGAPEGARPNFYFLITLATAAERPGVMTLGMTLSAVGFLTMVAIFLAAANFIPSVMVLTFLSSAPRKMPGKAKELLT